MDAAAQLEAIKANSTPQYNMSVRQITGGTIVSGQVTYVDKATGGGLAQQSFEAVATDAESAGSMVTCFLRHGSFTPPPPAPAPTPLFDMGVLSAPAAE